MPILRLFASARDAAGTARATVEGETVAEVLASASDRYGPRFDEVLRVSRIWVNGEAASTDHRLDATDEVAVLPPVSGGAS